MLGRTLIYFYIASGSSSIRRKAPSPPKLSPGASTPSLKSESIQLDILKVTSNPPSPDSQEPSQGCSGLQGSSTRDSLAQNHISPVVNVTNKTEKKVLPQVSIEDLGPKKIEKLSSISKVDHVNSKKSLNSFPNSPSRQFESSSNTWPISPSRQLESSPGNCFSDISIPSQLGRQLAEEVRRHTDLSHNKSCLAVEVVLGHISSTVPQIAGVMEKIMMTFQSVSTLLLTI